MVCVYIHARINLHICTRTRAPGTSMCVCVCPCVRETETCSSSPACTPSSWFRSNSGPCLATYRLKNTSRHRRNFPLLLSGSFWNLSRAALVKTGRNSGNFDEGMWHRMELSIPKALWSVIFDIMRNWTRPRIW